MDILPQPQKNKGIFYVIGKAILFASMQFAIGSVEMFC